jgi:uncharacterized membrane protein
MFLHICQLKDAGNVKFSKPRLDTLSDGIFGVAMTLLILDVRLPEEFHPQTVRPALPRGRTHH